MKIEIKCKRCPLAQTCQVRKWDIDNRYVACPRVKPVKGVNIPHFTRYTDTKEVYQCDKKQVESWLEPIEEKLVSTKMAITTVPGRYLFYEQKAKNAPYREITTKVREELLTEILQEVDQKN